VLFDESSEYVPGDLASVTIPHLPNMRGGRGLSGEIFEVVSYSPQESNGTAQLTLIKRRNPDGLGHIAPVLIVESVSSPVVTVRAASYSKYAHSSNLFVPPGNTSYDGTEDLHWFLESDNVSCWDASTFGSSVTTTQTTITDINYSTREIRLNSLPGWLGPGDLIRLDDWSTIQAGGRAEYREDIFVYLADDSTGLLDTDDPYRWGI
jgi:hypothetical protein